MPTDFCGVKKEGRGRDLAAMRIEGMHCRYKVCGLAQVTVLTYLVAAGTYTPTSNVARSGPSLQSCSLPFTVFRL